MARKDPHDLIPTSAALLQRLKDDQDQASWLEFYDIYWEFINGVAIKAGLNEAEAKDVLQETMILVFRQMPAFKYDPAIGSFQKWLLNTTRWRITDQLRKRFWMVALDTHADTDDDTGPAGSLIDPVSGRLDAIWDAEWKQKLLDAAIAKVKHQVDPAKYQVFDFCVNKEWLPDKVAKAFGIAMVPLSTVTLEIERQSLALVEISDSRFFRPTAAICKWERVHSPALKQFLETLKDGE
jgi:RNA polymerase sigma-70 factor (ECF subfamily)